MLLVLESQLVFCSRLCSNLVKKSDTNRTKSSISLINLIMEVRSETGGRRVCSGEKGKQRENTCAKCVYSGVFTKRAVHHGRSEP